MVLDDPRYARINCASPRSNWKNEDFFFLTYWQYVTYRPQHRDSMSEAHLYGGFIEWAKDEVTARSHRQGEGVDVFFFFYTSFFPCGNSGRLIRVRPQQPQEQRYPFLTVRAVFSCVQTKIWLPLFWIYNVRRDVNASDCTGRLYGHRKSLHWKLTQGEKSLAAPGNRTCVSGVPVRCCTNWATSPSPQSSSNIIW